MATEIQILDDHKIQKFCWFKSNCNSIQFQKNEKEKKTPQNE